MDKVKVTKKGRRSRLAINQAKNKFKSRITKTRAKKNDVAAYWYTTTRSPSSTDAYSDSELDEVNVESSYSEYSYYCPSADDNIYSDKYAAVNTSIHPEPEEFKSICMRQLTSEDMWKSIINDLQSSGNLEDFMTFINMLHSGDLPMDNIVFLLLLERCRFGSSDNTVGMRYRNVTKLFWSVVYRLCKSSGLKFFSGSKNWGQVVSKETNKSQYLGSKSKINFAVPDEKILRNLNDTLPKVIPPGKIHRAMNILRNEKDIILMADGKMISKGLGDHFTGDIDLFGHETEPNLADLKNDLEIHLNLISQHVWNFEEAKDSDKFGILSDTCEVISHLIKRIRIVISENRRKYNGYRKCQTVSDKTISKLKTNMYTCSIWIRKALKLNSQLVTLLACLQTNSGLLIPNTELKMSQLQNCRMLHEAELVSDIVDPLEFPHLIRRESDLSEDLQEQSLMTSNNCYIALGLQTATAMKDHFNRFIMQNSQSRFEPIFDFQAHLDGFGTTASLFMPAFLPSCATLYEEGCRFIDGNTRQKIICCQISGVIR